MRDEIKASPVSVIVVVVCVIILVVLPVITGKKTNDDDDNVKPLSEVVSGCKFDANFDYKLSENKKVFMGDFTKLQLESDPMECVYDTLAIPEYIVQYILKTATLRANDPAVYSEAIGNTLIKWIVYSVDGNINQVYLQIIE